MSDAFIGEIRLVPYFSSNPPNGWAFCNGALQSIQQNPQLYAVIGTIYGGDGVSTFGLPNLNGRVLVDQGTGVTAPPAGGTALTARTAGQTGGTETVALTQAMIPSHDHPFYATTQANSSQNPTGLFYGSNNNGTYKRYVAPVPTSPAPTFLSLDETTVQSAGGNAAHLNMMAGLGLRYIICITAGIFPVRP
jgi:microcystin-dependent protein